MGFPGVIYDVVDWVRRGVGHGGGILLWLERVKFLNRWGPVPWDGRPWLLHCWVRFWIVCQGFPLWVLVTAKRDWNPARQGFRYHA
jgi:hypothetical protein